ncbi:MULTISPECIES: TolC family protein [unclassified Spirosoma]|uniref:TolC family protein n=1 Tax=unclassified Spirosoma TaxID=2621999 RepID=UPI00095FF914|nr:MULTISPECIES: TolC family protein [unclassified Spirosoma]MBN8822529.1 TolC family protein [Spirosoma sp.]OJW74030.1 MAG: transporter [Spirosoma sp. 48-14]
MKYAFVLAGIFLGQLVRAQPAGSTSKPISLTEALELAQTNRLEIASQKLQVELAESDEARRRAAWQPQINLGADLRWNTQIQRNIIKNAPFANNQDVVLRFGTPFSNALTAQAEQKIYDAQSRIDRHINQLTVDKQRVTLDKQGIDIRQQVTEAYYQAVFNREKQRLSDLARLRARSYLEQAQTRFQAGTLLQTDFDRFTLDLSNAEMTFRNDQRDYALSLENLRYRIQSPQAVEPVDSLRALFEQFSAQELAAKTRPELQQEEADRQINVLNQRREQARLAPLVTGYGAYAAQQFADVFNPFQSGTWFPYNYVGVKVSMPIYNGRQARINRQDYVRRAQINQNTMQQLQNDFDYELRSARNTLDQARENLSETQKNITQAQAILAVDRVRFEAGTLVLADFRNSEYSLQQAENNYLRAVYDVLLGQIQVRKAQGSL